MDLTRFKKNDVIGVLSKDPVKLASQSGRPKKAAEEMLSCPVTINITEAEKGKLVKLSKDSFGMPITSVIRGLLKKHGYI